jgi:NAD+ synthase
VITRSIEDAERIRADLGVSTAFDPRAEIQRRVAFLTDTLTSAGRRCFVVAISGGVDSAVAGRLCHLAVQQARRAGHDADLVAMRLPYGRQRDEADAQVALDFVAADQTLTVDIQPACDACLGALVSSGLAFADLHQQDFILGNIKARQRMVMQYAVAGAAAGLVIGTDHAAEAVTGFFTKHGDGAADLLPLAGLTKRRVRHIARLLEAPPALVAKAPTADLENLRPGRPDEDALGISYQAIDDLLEGSPVEPDLLNAIVERYEATSHKRRMPLAPPITIRPRSGTGSAT